MKKNNILEYLSVITISLILILVVGQVVMRYIFNSPLTWSEELAVFAMVWLTFIGSVICMRDREHIEIEILVDHLPPKIRRIVIVVSRMISALFLLLLAWYGLELTMENFSTKSAANGIPMGYVYIIIPLGALGMLYYVVKSIRKGA